MGGFKKYKSELKKNCGLRIGDCELEKKSEILNPKSEIRN